MKEKKKTPLASKMMLTTRVLVGAYLLYVSYSLIESVKTGADSRRLVMAFFLAAFALIGLILIVFSGKALADGRYTGGSQDPQKEAEDAGSEEASPEENDS